MIEYYLDGNSIESRIGLSKLLISLGKGKWRIGISQFRKRHTDPQRKYLFGVVYPTLQAGFKEAWGETLTVHQIHYAMKDAFLTKFLRHNGPKRAEMKIPTTTTLTAEDFATYIDDVARFGAECLSVSVPEPQEKFAGTLTLD